MGSSHALPLFDQCSYFTGGFTLPHQALVGAYLRLLADCRELGLQAYWEHMEMGGKSWIAGSPKDVLSGRKEVLLSIYLARKVPSI